MSNKKSFSYDILKFWDLYVTSTEGFDLGISDAS